MISVMVKLWDKWDDEIFIMVPIGRPKRKNSKAKKTVMEKLILWWSRMKGGDWTRTRFIYKEASHEG